MDVLEAVKKRRSIRKYAELPVEWDKVVSILEAGRFAPSAGNLQDWKFIVITKKDTKQKIAQACLNQVWMEEAPIHIVICSNPEKTLQYYGKRGEIYTIQDNACVAMNMMLAATEEGLGTCWVGAFDETMMRLAVGIPDRARPEMIITVGYADEEVPVPPRTVLESLVFLHKYGNRMGDVNAVMWDWSLMMEEYAKGAKAVIQKKMGKLKETIEEKKKEAEASGDVERPIKYMPRETISDKLKKVKKKLQKKAEKMKEKKEKKLLKEYE